MKIAQICLAVCMLSSTGISEAVLKTSVVVVGVNIRGYGGVSEQKQTAKVEELQANRVKTIREAFPSTLNTSFNQLIIKAYQHGIGTVAIIYPTLGGDQKHTSATDAANGRPWRTPALLDCNPEQFRRIFAAQLVALEDAGVKLTAIELGNEFNTVGYNADFPVHSSGRVLGITDLDNSKDLEARAVAAGYLQYMKIVAVAKDVRDHSRINRSTPILSGGLANVGLPGPHSFNKQLSTSVPDTIAFFRQNGMDRLIDGYSVHAYTSNDPHQSISQRVAVFNDVFRSCKTDRPCWLTEWAFNNQNQSCPIQDDIRAQLVEAQRAALKPFIAQGRLAASIYYSWDGDFPGQKENIGAIFRCGALTKAGTLALSPM
jgi:hypothetical protein